MKRSLGADEWVRRVLGVAVLAGAVAVAFGLDRDFLTRLSLASTSNLEQRLVDHLHPHSARALGPNDQMMMARSDQMMAGKDQMMAANDQMMAGNQQMKSAPADAGKPNSESMPLPDLVGATAWINSPALTPASLRGKVVVIDFWTYSCISRL